MGVVGGGSEEVHIQLLGRSKDLSTLKKLMITLPLLFTTLDQQLMY